jgi:predicted nucleic acid-binding protein
MKPMPEIEFCFVDTNIWPYAFIDEDAAKKNTAQKLIRTSRPVISGQVISEVCVNLIKRVKFPEVQIRELIETFYAKYEVIELHKELLLYASQLRQEYALSYWDSQIVAAALLSGVKTLYSEDMQHGQNIGKTLKIVNPFSA